LAAAAAAARGGGSAGGLSGRDAVQSPPLAFTQHDFLTLLADSSPLPSKDFKKLPQERGSEREARHAAVAKQLAPPHGSARGGGGAADALDAATPAEATAGPGGVTPAARERTASAVNFMDLLFAGTTR
jgi:glutamate 5-kinase